MGEILNLTESRWNEGRFSRLELIDWWDQDLLSDAKALVVGAGAIGNEIIKNLSLVGVGNVFIADLDLIENSNLSRSVLYRESDCGKSKAEIAAKVARQIYPDQNAYAWQGNVVYDLGLGIYRWADVILAGLDNREARVTINQAASKLKKPWIDGAIERLDGVARVFDPSTGPCYECTMSETDWKMLEARRSCALLTREEMEQGKVPTTPTTASVVAGIQVQEALKMLHGQQTLTGQGFVFEGTNHQSYVVQYSTQEDCPTHDHFDEIEVLNWKVSETQVGDLLEKIQSEIGGDAVIETNHDLLASLTCKTCNETQDLYRSLGKVTEGMGICSQCGEARTPNVYHTIGSDSDVLDKSLSEIGVPCWDILGGRCGMNQRFYEFDGDRENLLGLLSKSEM